MLTTVRRTARLIGAGEWRKWLLLVFLALMVSAFEVAGAAMVFVLVTVVASPSGPIDLPVFGDIRGVVGDMDNQTLLVWLVVVLASFFLLRAVVRIGAAYAQARVAYNAGARLSTRLAAAYFAAPYSFHLRRSSSILIRNAHTAVNQLVGDVFLPVLRIAAETLVVIGLLVVMLVTAPGASLIAIAVIGGSALLLLALVQPKLKRLGRTAHAANEETLSVLQQSLQGIRDVKYLGRERWFTSVYGRARRRLARAFYLRNALTELPRTIVELSLVGFILVYFGIAVVAQGDSSTSVSVLGLFAYVGLRLQPSIQKIIAGLNSLKFASAPVDEIEEDLRSLETPHSIPPPERLQFTDELVLSGVEFTYEGAHEPALVAVNLTIRRGEVIGICGPTGGGKSTLVDVIGGLIEPTFGSVTVDGLDLRDKARSWHENLGVVSQDVFLLDDSLRRNIALGVSDDQIDDDAVEAAIALAQIQDYVRSLPDGLDSAVGERGTRLSGGQRQRIAIARALYRKPEVLIFDEGTSALDNETEAALMESIEGLRTNHTILLVAHRLTTVRNADRVILVDAGRITADGEFDEVIADAI